MSEKCTGLREKPTGVAGVATAGFGWAVREDIGRLPSGSERIMTEQPHEKSTLNCAERVGIFPAGGEQAR